jgi:protein-tyrosine-phosphatase
MATILVVGAADTGRAPMAAALLLRLLRQRGNDAAVESAGVLGHDGDPAETEARDTMAHMALDISTHQARSIAGEMAAGAALLLAIDHGTALVLRARFPAAADRIHTLGELAGRRRDIPDPFRMQIGAWITYAREIEDMLRIALPRIVGMLPPTTDDRPVAAERSGEAISQNSGRAAAAGRIEQLFQFAARMPGVVDWGAARARIEADLAPVAAAPYSATDLVAAYAGLLRAALAILPPSPSAEQLAALHRAAARLAGPIDQSALDELSAQVAALPGLA